jgi:hypothetical protein
MRFGDVKPPRTKPVTHDQVAEETFVFFVFLICCAAIVLSSI